jgi:hypothetical protein
MRTLLVIAALCGMALAAGSAQAEVKLDTVAYKQATPRLRAGWSMTTPKAANVPAS